MGKRIIGAMVFVLAAGCGREEVRVYRLPKEPTPLAAMPVGHPDVAAPTPQLTWQTPAGWTEMPAGEFRVASFKAAGADVSVIPLPGVAGGDFSNVNRWRGQVGLEPVSEEEMKKLAEPVTVAGQPAALYDQAGEASRILAVIQHRAGTAWFFKMTGAPQLVGQQKPAFIEFLQSVQFDSRSAAAPGKPVWSVPAGWQEAPAGQFLVAKFNISGTEAAVNVSASAGDGGGLAANVTRWRKQLGLPEVTGDEIAKSVKAMGPVTLVELTGQSAALVGAIVAQSGQTWFYKLMGDPAVVAAQKDAFIQFVQEVKY